MTMIPLARFIAEHKITMAADWADSNPNRDPSDRWNDSASHWRCTFRRGRRRMTTYFSMGPAHTKEPTAKDVLDCLASDSGSVENARSFKDWASDLGYDPDSRKAERTFRICERQAKRLRQFLGSQETYESLLWQTERL